MVQRVGQAAGSSVVTPDLIAKESLYRLMHNLLIPRLAAFTYERYFSDQIGDKITVKRPYKTTIQDGRVLSRFSALYDETVEIQVDIRKHFAMRLTDEDMTLYIQNFGDRYLQSGVEEMAYAYDEAGGEELVNNLFMYDGTPGSSLTTKSIHDLRAQSQKMAIPRNDRNYGLLDPSDIAELSDDIKNINVPDMVQGMLRERYMGKLAGYHLFECVHIPYLNTATGVGTPLVNRSGGVLGSTIPTDGWTASTKVLYAGSLIQIANVNQIEPRGSRRVTGKKMTFTVLEDVTSNASGEADVKVYPTINDGTLTANDAQGNSTTLDAYKTVDAKPANNAAITIVGASSSSAMRYRQGVFYERDALQYANIQLTTPKSAGISGSAVEPNTGLSVTYTGDYDITNAQETNRVDCLFGVKCVYPELGIRFLSDNL